MQDFIDVLVFIQTMLVRILSLRIPLGSDYSISYGSIVFSLIFIPVLFKILSLIFAVSVNDGVKSDSRKGPKFIIKGNIKGGRVDV